MDQMHGYDRVGIIRTQIKTQKKHGCSYGEAMKKAKITYKK